MAAEPRRAPTSTLTGIDVEELARHRDDLLVERRFEEAHAIADRGRQVLRGCPHLERALRRQINREAEIAQTVPQLRALLADLGLDRAGLRHRRGRREQLDRLALQRPR